MQLTTVDGDEQAPGVTLLMVTVPEEIAAAAGIQPVVRVAVFSESRSGEQAERDIQGAADAVDALLQIRFGMGGR
ncbi:hypothetical protein P7L87_26775 [Vibrio parahaemolyticus]|nr:hypothetical protein [Vibrio parahaemolyticus]